MEDQHKFILNKYYLKLLRLSHRTLNGTGLTKRGRYKFFQIFWIHQVVFLSWLYLHSQVNNANTVTQSVVFVFYLKNSFYQRF